MAWELNSLYVYAYIFCVVVKEFYLHVVLSIIVFRQIYLGPNWYDYSGLEWTWES